MSTKKYPIRLTRDEQQQLEGVVSRGRTRSVQADPRGHPADE